MPPKQSPNSSAPGSPAGKAMPSPPSTTHSSSSDSSSMVKVSSPLNPGRPHSQSPATTPTMKTTPLPSTNPTLTLRGQSHSTPAHRETSPARDPNTHPHHAEHISRVMSNPLPTASSSSSLSTISFHRPGAGSTFRSRSRSASQSRSREVSPNRVTLQVNVVEEEGLSPASTWWNRKVHPPRPWSEAPKRKKTIPAAQTEGYLHTRERVVEAAASVLGTAARVAHEALFVGVDLLQFAPVVGLETAGRTLLNIWDALEMVEMNRLACLRLTERCADALISVRDEILDAGGAVLDELKAPIAKLNEAFMEVNYFLKKQAHRPFLKRYLKRDEILRSIAVCDAGLSDALGMFGLSIQIRTLKLIQVNEARRQAEATALLNSLGLHDVPGDPSLQLPGPAAAHIERPASPSSLGPAEIRTLLQNLRARQNEEDRTRDMMDLRQLMRTALETNNDVAMIEVLQVGRDEMPEAIKTLQRALEREVERSWSGGDRSSRSSEGEGSPILERSNTTRSRASSVFRPRGATVSSINDVRATTYSGTTSQSTDSGSSDGKRRAGDTLDREFMEGGIDALRRLSQGTELVPLPSWTITRYEVDLEEKIGIGFFSDVYKGVWREHTVAIKVLAETTPRKLFVHEISIWKTLSHPNVLELLGASSASGDPPWFFVSPYYSNGSLVSYLKGLESMIHVDLLKMIHEIAKGMAYLHEQGVLHGDLKAANVLVDDHLHCVISDFGQSEMKSEVYRISRTPLPHGTLRWQAPELMLGVSDALTQEIDIYAFAICCCEILTKGTLPWPLMDDDAVRHLVLVENMRPSLPLTHLTNSGLTDIVQACWVRTAANRPSFAEIAKRVKRLRVELEGSTGLESPRPQGLLEQWRAQENTHSRPSPDMHPIGLPEVPTKDDIEVGTDVLEQETLPLSRGHAGTTSAPPGLAEPMPKSAQRARDDLDTIRPGLFYPGSDTSSVDTLAPDDSLSGSEILSSPRHASPPPLEFNEETANVWNERRYRMLLQHEFHTSLTLPLWSPSPVALGAVGYLSKPGGSFTTLFNCFDPTKTGDGMAGNLPSLSGYGKVSHDSQRQDKRNAALRGLDLIQSFLYKNKGEGPASQTVSRTQSFQLRAGHKVAYLYAETTLYRFMVDLSIPKKWFQNNIDNIVKMYGQKHQVTKEDIFLVIGTLDAQDYALFVSHSHPDGQVNFNIFTAGRPGAPWGAFSTTTGDLSSSMTGGPQYHEEIVGSSLSANKVSKTKPSGASWDSVLLARLRFKPDVAEPTSL
ncbi:hypothetical protein DENSPDRAFT_63475 [Dentipellis sp. KUC8613]|nr:hypothetical protein DENSPDRAFT_63475 [Dentipellis sp. KUC8613]